MNFRYNPAAKYERASRKVVRRITSRDAILGNEVGQADCREKGYHWARFAASADVNNNATFGPSFAIRANPGAGYAPVAGRRVRIQLLDEGEWEVVKGNFLDMIQGGYDPRALNPNSPERAFNYIDELVDTSSRGIGSGLLVQVQGWKYNTADYTFKIDIGTDALTQIDLTSFRPGSVDTHRYAVVAFNVTQDLLGNPPWEVYGGTSISLFTKLAEADIQTAYNLFPKDQRIVPVKAYYLEYGQTVIKGPRFDVDLRTAWNLFGVIAREVGLPQLADGTPGKVIGYDGSGHPAEITVSSGAPTNGHYVTTQAESGLSNEFNLGGLASGLLKQVVAAGVSTPSIAAAGTDYTTPTGTEPLSGKTITASSLIATALSLIIGGFRGIFTHANSADRTYTLPNYDGTLATLLGTEAFANKTINTSDIGTTTPGAGYFSALRLIIGGFKGIFSHSNTADRTYTFPNYNATLSPNTTKGDLVGFNGTDNVRVPVGADGKYAMADSSTATGLTYADITIDIPVTWGEAVSAARLAVFLDPSDGKWYLMNAIGTIPLRVSAVRGVIASAGSGAINTAGVVRLQGQLPGFASSLTANLPIFAGTTNGALTQTEPVLAADAGQYALAQMGWAYTSSIMFVNPQPVTYRMRTASFDPAEVLMLIGHKTSPSWVRPYKAWRYVYNEVLNANNPSSNRDFDMALKGLQTSAVADNSGTAVAALGSDATNARRVAQSMNTLVGRISQFTQGFGSTVGTPTGTVTWAFETDNAGKPSGTLVDASLTGTFTPTASTTSTITIASGYQFVSGVPVWLTLTSTAWQALNNYWQVQYNASGVYAGGSLKGDPGVVATTTWNGGWASFGGTFDLRMTVTTVSYDRLAQRLTNAALSSKQVMSVKLWLKKVGAPTGDLQVFIYSNVSNLPNALISNGTSATVLVSSLSTSYGWITFTFPTPPTIGTFPVRQHIVLTTTSAASNSAYVHWGADVSSVSGDLMSADTASAWSAINPAAAAIYEVYTRDTGHPEALQEGNWTAGTGQYAYRVGDTTGDDQDRVGMFLCNSVSAIDTVYVDMTVP